MALTPSQVAEYRRFAGPIPPDDEDRVDEAVARLGSAYGAALEDLMSDLAEFSRSSESISGGTDRESHTRNVEWVEAQIGRLVRFVRGNDSVTVGEEFEALLVGFELASVQFTQAISVVAGNARRA